MSTLPTSNRRSFGPLAPSHSQSAPAERRSRLWTCIFVIVALLSLRWIVFWDELIVDTWSYPTSIPIVLAPPLILLLLPYVSRIGAPRIRSPRVRAKTLARWQRQHRLPPAVLPASGLLPCWFLPRVDLPILLPAGTEAYVQPLPPAVRPITLWTQGLAIGAQGAVTTMDGFAVVAN
jgi:hypothetical protein